MSRRHRAGGALVLGALLAVASCSSPDDPGGRGVVDDTLPPGGEEAGSVVRAEPLPDEFPAAAWRVTYRSETDAGEPTTVTGVVAAPVGPPPEEGYPVLAFGHGTTGIADACAPSSTMFGLHPVVDRFVEAGWVVAATDYEGLGGPGVHPYLDADSEARSVLDAARAAIRLVPDTGERVVLHGESQGGHAVLAAAERADDFAPELDVLGTVAMAPVADVGHVLDISARFRPLSAFAVTIAGGWSEVDPDLAPEQLLTDVGLVGLDRATDDACFGELVQESLEVDERAVVPVAEIPPAWTEAAEDNSIDGAAVPGPVLVAHGVDDEILPVELSETLVGQLCAAGREAELRTYDADHGGILDASLDEAVRWAADRLAGARVPSSC